MIIRVVKKVDYKDLVKRLKEKSSQNPLEACFHLCRWKNLHNETSGRRKEKACNITGNRKNWRRDLQTDNG